MSVYLLLSAVTDFFKWRSPADKADIDGFAFKAHYKLTAALLVGCSVLVTANNLIGEPITCLPDGAIPYNVINTFCWISHTFTLPNKTGKEVAHPGVSTDNGDEPLYHSYYQWVPFVLFFQGVMFYAPHWLWKIWEGGKVHMITDSMRVISIDQLRGDQQNCQKQALVQYLFNSLRLHNVYALGYFMCEIFNFLNVIGNMYLINSFLGGEFWSYGIKVLEFSLTDQQDRRDPMITIFPRVTKCMFQKFGPSGTIQTHDVLCVLPLNILNEKIYILLWFWFIVLAIISAMSLVYSFALIMMPSVRKIVLLRRYKFGTPQEVSTLVRKTQVGDFLFYCILGQNINILQFRDVLKSLSLRLHTGDDNLPMGAAAGTNITINSSNKLRLN